ncbi:hypothetical protein CsatA_016187 [Cannabis sativa]
MRFKLFKSKPRTPRELIHHFRDLLLLLHGKRETRVHKRQEKMEELCKRISEIKITLFGDEAEPSQEACSQLTQEFFKEDTFRILILFIPTLNLGSRIDATHVIANLLRQQVNKSRFVGLEYLKNNLDIVDILLSGYEDTNASDVTLSYGSIARECIRYQDVAKYVLDSQHMKKFFNYIQIPTFEISSDAALTFKELVTRHKSTAADFLAKNYEWFFQEYNSKLLDSSSNYITKRNAAKLLAEILLDRSNTGVMVRYVSSLDNMRVLMNLLRESNRGIQLETFHVFKLFVDNQNKPEDIVLVLLSNKSKLLRFFEDFNVNNKEDDELFLADKDRVVNEIRNLKPRKLLCRANKHHEIIPCVLSKPVPPQQS